MPANPKGDKPADIGLNLDTLEREDAPEPFAFVLGGERFECADPSEVDYRELAKVPDDDLAKQLEMLLGGKQYLKFTKHGMPAWKLNRLMESIRDHYQLGEDAASPL